MPGPREVVRTGWPGWPQVGLAAAAIKQDRPGIDRVDGQHPVASPLSCARRSRTACSEGAEIACKISHPSPPRGPPRRMNPSSTRASMNRACSSQPSCSRRPRDQFHGPPRSSRTAKNTRKAYRRACITEIPGRPPPSRDCCQVAAPAGASAAAPVGQDLGAAVDECARPTAEATVVLRCGSLADPLRPADWIESNRCGGLAVQKSSRELRSEDGVAGHARHASLGWDRR